MELKFKKLQEDAVLPSYANPNDAGLDLTAVSFTQEFDKSGKLVLVYHTGLSVEIPEGHVGLIFMRSSVSQKSMSMCNAVGIVDCDYKGEILVKFKITTDALPTIYQPGEKIAQLVVMPYPKIEPVIVEELAGEDRGGGFGSTDKKEENATSEEGQDTTTSMEQHSEEESNSENPGIQGQENPTVGQETTLRPSPAQG